MSDKLNETFKKHLKLLHEHLNINEARWIPFKDAEAEQEKEKKDYEDNLERKSDEFGITITKVIKMFGMIKWQVFKRKNINAKAETLYYYIIHNQKKVSKEIGDEEYSKLTDLLTIGDPNGPINGRREQYMEIVKRSIEKAEKLLGRGFLEQ